MEPFDTFWKEWPEVAKARSSVASLVGVGVILSFGFASILYSTSLSGKDATIENLKTGMERFKNERDDITKNLDDATKRLASSSGQDKTIEALRTDIEGLKTQRDQLQNKLSSIPTGPSGMEALSQVSKERDDLQRQLYSSKNEIGELRDQLNKNINSQQSAKSPLLGLDDSRRFQIIKALTDGMPGDKPGCNVIQAFPPMSPESAVFQRTAGTWGEVQQPLFYAGWRFFGGSNAFIPPGISIVVGAQSGHNYECGLRLKELLDGLGVHPVSLRIDVDSPELAACRSQYKLDECIEVTVGELESH